MKPRFSVRPVLATVVLLAGLRPFVAAGPLRPHAENPRYFTDDGGSPIFLTGSHSWANFMTDQGGTAVDYAGYLDFLEAHHHNFFRGWVWDLPHSNQAFNGGPFRWGPQPWARTGAGLATDGLPKFDLDTWNPVYFQRLRERVRQAGERDIYVSIMLFQGFAWQFDRTDTDGFPLDGRNNINGVDCGPSEGAAWLEYPAVTAAEEAYVRKVIDTVNDLDNVLYEISNESSQRSTAWQYHMIEYIHAYEATLPNQHPVGMTYQYSGEDATGVSNQPLYDSPADWISPNNFPEIVIDPPAADGSKVIVFDTDHGYGWQDLKRDGPDLHRVWAWKNLCRGNNTLFMDPYLAKSTAGGGKRNHPTGENAREPYFGTAPDPYWGTLRITLGDTRRMAQRLDLAHMVPHGDLSSTGFCLAAPGREYLVYDPSTSFSKDDSGRRFEKFEADGKARFTVDLEAGTYAYEWLNPKTGQPAETGTFEAADGPRECFAPFVGDAVLRLRRVP